MHKKISKRYPARKAISVLKQYLGPRSEPDLGWLSKILSCDISELISTLDDSSRLLAFERQILRILRGSGRLYYAQFPAALELYVSVRVLRPCHVLESGVSSGVSSAHLLLGLHENGCGVLHSIDLPIIQRTERRERGLPSWTIPREYVSGWAVPRHVKHSWDLKLGSSEELLPKLLRELPEVDLYVHDSPQSARHLGFELKAVKPRLHAGSVVIADNTNWPSKPFERFAASIRAQVQYRGQSSLCGLRVAA